MVDMWGRRWGMVIGAALIVIGSLVQGASQNKGMFIGARFILGFGVNISASAGPAYVVEIAPPSWRGAVTGVYNTFWFMGAIPASWVTFGTARHLSTSNMSWRIPLYLQCVFSGCVLVFSLLLPESPRWLFANDRHDEALAILAKYHGEGDPNDSIVQLQIREFQDGINSNGSDKKWWDYREVFGSRNNLYRLLMVFLMAFIGQWSGNAVVSYFMPYALEGAGVKDGDTQRLLSALMTVLQFIFALVGASIVDRFGRRTMMFYGEVLFTIYFIIITALSSQFDAATGAFPTKAMSNAVITFIYFFGITYSVTMTPMQALYPVECLKYETRAKGMALNGLFIGLAGFYNLFVTSIAQVNIGWKYYYWFIAENALAAVIIFFVFVETKGRTLEELEEVFNAPNPNKASRRKHHAEVESGVGAISA
jgi:sugar porter (SP) family MFS transporter